MKSILVHIVHHPIERHNVTKMEVPSGQSLLHLKQQFTSNQEQIVLIDAQEIPPADWANVYPSANSKVVFGPAIADPVTMYLFGTTLAGAIWYVAVNAAIAYGLAYLGGLLFGSDVQQPQRRAARERGQSFGWSPQTTRQEGIPKAIAYGRNLHYGNMIARWTDVVGADEKLYMILDSGGGPILGKVGEVYFNDQPSGYYSGVDIQERLGTLNQDHMTGFDKLKLEYSPNAVVANGSPVTWLTPNNFFDDVEYTLEWPRGLYHYQDDGSRVQHSVGVTVQIRVRDTPPWVTLINNVMINGDQLEPLYKAYSANTQVPGTVVYGNQYELRVTKTSADQDPGRYGDTLHVRRVREVVNTAFTYPGRSLLGIRALATERLNQRLNVSWVSDDKLVNCYNGAAWEIKHTRNRADIWLDELTQPVISGDGNGGGAFKIESYEGISPEWIDLAGVYEWKQWCATNVPSGLPAPNHEEERMTCDVIVDWQTDVWSLAYEIAQVGRFNPYWHGTILTGWLDTTVSEYADLVTFDNIMTRFWKNSWAGYAEMAGKVEVFYKDALYGYERKSIPVHNALAGTYNKIVDIEAIGVTSRSLAIRVGSHVLNRNKLIKNVNSGRLYKSALRYKLGQTVRLQATIPNWGATYRVIQSETEHSVQLDRVLYEVLPGDIVFVKCYNEATKAVSIDSYTVASVLGKVLTIVEGWLANVTPIKGNVLALGKAGKIKTRRIIRMRQRQDNYTDVEFETYDTVLFASDQTQPAAPNPDYIRPQPPAELSQQTRMTRWEAAEIINRYTPPVPNTDMPATSNCEWKDNWKDDAPNAGYVSWVKRDPAKPILFRHRDVTYEIAEGSTDEKFIYWNISSPAVFLSTNTMNTAFGLGKWMVRYNYSGVSYTALLDTPMPGQTIETGTVDTLQIVNSAITTAKLNGLAVTLAKLAEDSVDNTKIVAGTVRATEIAAFTILAGNIAAEQITTAKLDALAVTAAKIAAYTILAGNMAANSIATASLQAGCITAASGAIANLAVETAKIKNLAVETIKIDNLAVTTDKIADHAVTREVAEYAINKVVLSSAGTTICGPLSLAPIAGTDVKLTVTIFYDADFPGDDDDFHCFFRENGNVIEATTSAVRAMAGWVMTYTKEFRYSPGVGTYDYTVKAFCTDDHANVYHRFFTVEEVKK